MDKRRRVVWIAVFVLAGCAAVPKGPPRIDGSTPQAFETSWSRLVKSLNAEQQGQLDTAILRIGATKLHDSGFQQPTSFSADTLRGELDGKTYQDILQAAVATGTTIQNASPRAGTP
jgi:hypothetical protein